MYLYPIQYQHGIICYLKVENNDCVLVSLKVSQFQKDFLLSSNSSKKRTKEFHHSTVRQKNPDLVRLFFGRTIGLKKNITALSDLYKIKTEPENRSLLIGLGPLRLALLGF